MSVTTIAWGGTNLPRCTSFRLEEIDTRVASRTGNHTLRIDAFSTKWRLTADWEGSSSSERTTLRNAYIAKGDAANNFTTPDNRTFSVMAAPGGWKESVPTYDALTNDFRYDIQIIVLEA